MSNGTNIDPAALAAARERLEKRLARASKAADAIDTNVADLRLVLDALIVDKNALNRHLLEQVDALRGEVERLREALNGACVGIESLVGRPTAIEVEMATAPIRGGPWITKGAAIEVVRAALRPTEGEVQS